MEFFLGKEGGGGGLLDVSLSGKVRPAPQTLTLFKTKMFRILIPCLAQNYTLFKKFAKKKYPV